MMYSASNHPPARTGRRMKNFLSLAASVIIINAHAADISFNHLASSSGENSALSGKCDIASDEKTMNCSFRQINFRKAMSEADAVKEYDDSMDDLNEAIKGSTIEDWVKKTFKECDKIVEKMNSGEDVVNKELLSSLAKLCTYPSRKSLESFIIASLDYDVKTCKVIERDTGTYTFSKVSDLKWVANVGPQGDCGAVVVMTLEQNALEHKYLWSFHQERIYTNLESKLCKDLSEINKPQSYSWKAPGRMKADCDYIEFGF